MAITDIRAKDLQEMIKNKRNRLEIIDVREPEEYTAIHIKGSKLIPMKELPERLNEIDWNKEVVFLCRNGNRSKATAKTVEAHFGKNIKNLERGIYECFISGKNKDLEIDKKLIRKYF